MQEKSRASLTTGDTAVLTIAADISWVRYWSRLRTTSSVIGSGMPDLDDDAPEAVYGGAVTGRHEDRRVAPLDQRGPGDRHPREETLAIVDRHRRTSLGAREPRHAGAAPRRRRIGRTEAGRRGHRLREAADSHDPAFDEVDSRSRRERAPPVELGVARPERLAEAVDRRAIERRERHRDLPGLAVEAEVDFSEEGRASGLHAFRAHRPRHVGGERREGGVEDVEVDRQWTEERAHGLAPHVRRRRAVGGEHGGETGNDDAPDGEGTRDRHREERSAAPVAEDGEAAGVEAALDQESLHGERHLLVGEPVHAARRLLDVQADGAPEPPERRHRALAVEHEAAAEKVARVEEPERDQSVGDRRLLATAP